jgi:hypothetical protein
MIARMAVIALLHRILGTPRIAMAAEPPDPAQAAIRTALTRWLDDFNVRRVGPICDLFDSQLRCDCRGSLERDHTTICALLYRSLADPDRQYRYTLNIWKILEVGDLVIVRLIWTLLLSGKALTICSGVAPCAKLDCTKASPFGSIVRPRPHRRILSFLPPRSFCRTIRPFQSLRRARWHPKIRPTRQL